MKNFKHIILALFAICLSGTAKAEVLTSVYPNIIENEDTMMLLKRDAKRVLKPIIYSSDYDLRLLPGNEGLTLMPLEGIRPLTGPSCTVNKLIKTVGVGSWNSDMHALTNDDLTDYAEFNGVARVSAAHDPIVSIRDMGCYYSNGMKAGFCVVASSGSVALDLKLIKMMSITFYRDGHALTDNNGAPISKLVDQADGTGLNLSLIQVPGSEDALAMLTATAPGLFDEISLNINGVDASVGSNLKIKYAFVGENKMYPITGDLNAGDARTEDAVKIKNGIVLSEGRDTSVGIYEYNLAAPSPVIFSYAKSWDPVLLGIPFPHVNNSVRRMLDTNIGAGTGPSIQPILDVGYKGGAKIMMKRAKADTNVDEYNDPNYYDIITPESGSKYKIVLNEENPSQAYPAGTEVGFKYTFGQALTLDLGVWAMIRLYDWQWNGKAWEEVLVQETNINSTAIGLTLASGGQQSASVTANVPFSGAEIRFYTVASVNVGAYSIDYGFVRKPVTGRHHCRIEPSLSTNICARDGGYFQLRSNTDVSVTWRLLSECTPTASSFQLPVYDEEYNITGYRDATPSDECWPDLQNIKVTPSGRVSGLPAINGLKVTFCAVAKDGCHEHVTLNIGNFNTRDPLSGVTALVNKAGLDPAYTLSTITGGGSLISISLQFDDEHPATNIIDGNLDNFGAYTKGTSIAANCGIVGIKTVDGSYIIDATQEIADTISLYQVDRKRGYKRVGFVVETVDGLDVKALEFLNIRLCKGGQQVYSHVIEESNAINADIAGNQKAVKTRFSIKVPFWDDDDQPLQFDEVQLWTSGLLKLGGETIKIYYAFYEDGWNDVPNPLNGDYQMLSANIYQEDLFPPTSLVNAPEWMLGTHATINGDATTYGGAVDALTITDNLSFFIDDDPDTYTLVSNTVAVGTGLTIAVNTGRILDNRYQLGVIIDNLTYLANVDVGGWLTVETFLSGVSTNERFSDWKVVGANVAGGGDKRFMLFSPKLPYDEVRITIAQGVAKVLDNMKLYGMFVRCDADGDGIPDDIDNNSCERTIPDVTVNDVCQGGRVKITIRGNESLDGADIELALSDPQVPTYQHLHMVKYTPAGQEAYAEATYEYDSDIPGEYELHVAEITNPSEIDPANWVTRPMLNMLYYVHPNKTTWSANASDNDWNKWDNWTDGSPTLCTDVVIPAGLDIYPVIHNSALQVEVQDKGVTTIYKFPATYGCDEIFFEHGATVGGIPALNYRKANIDLRLEPNQYYQLSAPLNYMYTGDMFVPAEGYKPAEDCYNPTLKIFTHDTRTVKRFNPIIYQRLYQKVAKSHRWYENTTPDVNVDDANGAYGLYTANTSEWTRNFNSVSRRYDIGEGFALWVDNDQLPTDSVYLMRFPQTAENYLYYEDFNRDVAQYGSTDINDNVLRTGGYDNGVKVAAHDNPYRFVYEKDDEGNMSMTAAGDSIRTVYRSAYSQQINLKQDKASQTFLFGNPYMSRISLKRFFNANPTITSVSFWDSKSATNYSVTYDSWEDELNVAGPHYVNCIPPMTSVLLHTSDAANTEMAITVNEAMLEDIMVYIAPIADELSRGIGAREALRILINDGDKQAGMLALGETDTESSATALMVFDGEIRPSVAVWGINADGDFCDIMQFAEGMNLGIYAGQGATMRFVAEGGFPVADYELYDAMTQTAQSLTSEVTIDSRTASVGRYSIRKAGAKIEGSTFLTQEGCDITAHSTKGNISEIRAYNTDGQLENIAHDSVITVRRGVKVITVRLANGETETYKVMVR